ncbi:hypothetical protein, partial [Klebsiella pneumoniae]|uniref:hypothetical protein n=1 Tax=Klebsiella pneumoniae TaxID=573 RepID=UPI002E787C2C
MVAAMHLCCDKESLNKDSSLEKYLVIAEFLLWLGGLQIRLVSMRMPVQSLVSLTGLKDLSLLGAVVYRLVAAAPIRPPAWELPYAAGVALK